FVMDPVAEHSPGVVPRQQLHPGVVRVAGALVPPGAQPAHVRRVTGELRLALARVALELADVDQRGDDRDPGLRGAGDRLVREAGGMLEAVESCVQSERDRGLGEGVDGEAGPGGMGGVGHGGEVLRLPTRGEVADAAVYPVPDQLHPAVATPRLPGRGGGEILGFDLVRVAAQVTAGTGPHDTTR